MRYFLSEPLTSSTLCNLPLFQSENGLDQKLLSLSPLKSLQLCRFALRYVNAADATILRKRNSGTSASSGGRLSFLNHLNTVTNTLRQTAMPRLLSHLPLNILCLKARFSSSFLFGTLALLLMSRPALRLALLRAIPAYHQSQPQNFTKSSYHLRNDLATPTKLYTRLPSTSITSLRVVEFLPWLRDEPLLLHFMGGLLSFPIASSSRDADW